MSLPPSPAWAQIEKLFHAALEVPAETREEWLREQAGDSLDLAAEVRSLLAAHQEAGAVQPVRRIGPYRLERLLGRGGMGEVWLATRADGQFQQEVAVKLMHSGLGAELLLPRFQRERQMLARLNHPNITRLLDGGIGPDGRPYLVMEYVDGWPLLQYFDEHHLSVTERLRLFRRLCSAVEFAHQNLVVHRDIKPGNVLVTADGSPKLLDFGIAKLAEPDAVDAATILTFLTPRYASPEQLRGEPATTASDVYSLGVLLFELLTGAFPYTITGGQLPEMIAAVASQEPRRASDVRRHGTPLISSGDLDAILAKALEKDMHRRYVSVERLSGDIENYLEGRPVTARPLTAAYRLQKYVRRHWIGVAAASGIAAALAIAALVSWYAAHIADQQRARAERVTQFLEDTLTSADPYSWQRATSGTKLADLLPSLGVRIREVFAGDAAAEARLHAVVADAYARLGEFPLAQKEVQLAIGFLPSVQNDPAVQAKVLLTAGYLDFRLSHYAAEEREMRQAVDIFEHTPALRKDSMKRALYLTALAVVLADVGKRSEATQTALRARQMIQAAPQDALQGGSLEASLSVVYMKIGDLEKSRDAARECVRKLSPFSKPLPAMADAEEQLGYLERLLGNSAGAAEAFHRSLQIYTQALGAKDPLAIPARIESAFQLALDGRPEQALPELRDCLAAARARSNQEDIFHALHELGYALSLANRPTEGEPFLREALRLGAGFLAPTGPTIGICKMQLGETLERQGRPAEALPLYQAALNNLRAYYGPQVYIVRQAQAHCARLSSVSSR